MSLDRSLKGSGRLAKHRNVLTRAERIEHLVKGGKFDLESDNPLGLVKVANRKVVTGSKAAKKKEEEGEAIEGEAPETPAATEE